MRPFNVSKLCGVGASLWITAALTAVISAAPRDVERIAIPAFPGSSFSAYPSVDRLQDGRLICVFSTRLENRDKLVLAKTVSDDHGRTWSQPEVLLDSRDGDDFDCSIVVIGSRVIVTATTTPLNRSTISTSRIMAVRSDDSGSTWSSPYEIPTGRRYTSGKVNNGIVLEDGAVLLGYTWEKNLDQGAKSLASEGDMEEVNAVLLSFDQGLTWAASESLGLKKRKAGDAPHAINGLCEPALVECRDGSVFMLSRTGLTNLYGSRSHDGGRSWSKPFATPLVSHNSPAALCSFEADRPGVLAVWNNSPRHRWPLCVAASLDDCRTWSSPRTIAFEEGLQSSYPGAVQAADGKLVVVYQQDKTQGREIRAVRFDPAWLASDDADPAKYSNSTPQGDGSVRPSPPETVARFNSMPKPAVLPGGTLACYFIDHEGPGLAATPSSQSVYARYSADEGKSWSAPENLVALPADAGGFGYFVTLVDEAGEVHFFMLCDAGTGVIRPRSSESGKLPVEPLARQRLDVWHAKSVDNRTAWTTPRRIWVGRAGDLQSVTQLTSGRIVLPLSYFVERNWSNRGDGMASFTYTGQFDTTVLYSDDAGQTWAASPSILRTVTPDLSSYGAVEPVVLELADGRVWMLLRTQLGRFYESFSDDGEVWSPPRPSRITSSDSPAALLRLPDQRILLLWNNCQRHPYAQGSRHVLHAAVSSDEGKSWRGYREILQDPLRNVPPPPNGDHGVSYPFVTVSDNADVFYSLWVQSGEDRTLEKLDPDWLEETRVVEQFHDGMANWSTFGTEGATLAEHPSEPDRRVLSLVKKNIDWPTAAVWNFPKGSRGRLTFNVRVPPNSTPLSVQLADHFSPPADELSGVYSVFRTELVDLGDSASDRVAVPSDEWSVVEIKWDCTRGTALALVDGKLQQVLKQQHASPGPSYLRLVFPAGENASAPVLVSEVQVIVAND